VDNAREVAPSVVALAVSYAQEGKQVVLADLADGAPAARLLQIKRPAAGTVRVNAVRVHGVSMMVAVPGRDSAALAGPLPLAGAAQPGMPGLPGPPGPPSEPVAAVYASADVLITLVTLDPAAGPDHLPTWADSAVVTVTAGQSTGTRIHAVGEMIRLAGTPLVSTVVARTDKHDESLGAAIPTPAPSGISHSGTSHNGSSDNGTGDSGQPAGSLRPTETPATGTPASETPATGTPATGTPATETPATETPGDETPGDEKPRDDTEDFEAIPATTDINGNRTPELVVTDGPRLTSGLPRPEWLPPD
jgi:hypothetical protein